MYNSQEIADRIKFTAKTQQKKISEILLSCNLGKNTVAKIAKGTDILTLNFAKIADCLNCSIDYLLGRTDNPTIGANSNINQSNVNSAHGVVSIGSDSSDELMQEFLTVFKELDFSDKIKVMDFVNKLKEK